MVTNETIHFILEYCHLSWHMWRGTDIVNNFESSFIHSFIYCLSISPVCLLIVIRRYSHVFTDESLVSNIHFPRLGAALRLPLPPIWASDMGYHSACRTTTRGWKCVPSGCAKLGLALGESSCDKALFSKMSLLYAVSIFHEKTCASSTTSSCHSDVDCHSACCTVTWGWRCVPWDRWRC